MGSWFVKKILAERPSWEVTNLDNLSYAGDLSRLEKIPARAKHRFIHADICSREAVGDAMRGAEMVFHFAAQTHVDRSLIDAAPFFDTNVIGTQVLLQTAVSLGTQRFVHVSTDEIYGPCAKGSFRESDAANPTNPYSISKLAAEQLVLNCHRHEGLSAVITRGSNTYGPFQYPEKVIPLFASRLLDGKTVPLYGDGLHVRDWLHVDDHISAVLFAAEKGKSGEVYNIPGNHALSNKALALEILSVLGLDESRIEHVTDRKGHDRRYALNGSKLKRLGWRHRKLFCTAFPETVRWYAERRDWVREITGRSQDYSRFLKVQYQDRSAS